VSFRLAGEEFGVDILSVQEIIRVGRVTPVPNTPSFVEGVLNLRGKVIPVIALRKRLGMPPVAHSKETRILVAGLTHGTLGFVVDSVSEVLRVPRERIVPAPGAPGQPAAPYLEGVARMDERLLVVLDLNRLLSAGETAGLAA